MVRASRPVPRGRVVVLGSINVDLVLGVTRRPGAGETVGDATLERHAGGKGANQALAAARAGAEVALVGRVGEDEAGTSRLAELEREGVDVARVRRCAAPTGTAVITLTPDGENAIVVVPGANGCVGPLDVEDAAPVLREADVLVLQLEIPSVAVTSALTRVAPTTLVVLNAAPARSLDSAVYERLDVLVVNESEAGTLCGTTVRGAETAGAAAALLAGFGARAVVVTLGAAGALVHEAGEDVLVAAPPALAVDTTGAGDAFVGALAARLAVGEPLTAAVGFANVVGAATAEHVGAAAVVPDARGGASAPA